MMIRVKTYQPFRRSISIRFGFHLLTACFFTVLLFSVVIIWFAKTCEKEKVMKKLQVSQSSFEEMLRIKEAKRCFRPKEQGIYDNLELLDDILEADKAPQPDQSIFFHETTCTQNGVVLLNAR